MFTVVIIGRSSQVTLKEEATLVIGVVIKGQAFESDRLKESLKGF